MRSKVNRLFCTALALLIALGAVPVLAKTHFDPASVTLSWSVPSGYNAHDYDKCAAFLELADANGVKNGTKLSASYDPNDPATWGSNWSGDFFAWINLNGEKMINKIDIANRDLVGALELSGCAYLAEVIASANRLTALNVSDCGSLNKLNCNENAINAPSLSGCAALETLYIAYNPLDELDLSSCAALEFLSCYSSGLTALDVSACTRLGYLSCYSNRLTALDLTHCPLLTELQCELNELGELDLSHNPALEVLDCAFTGLDSLELSRNTALRELDCRNNNLSEVQISHLTALTELDCRNNALTELEVSANAALNKLFCSGNKLTLLELSQNPSLAYDSVSSSGEGYIGYDFSRRYYGDSGYLFARPLNGASFEGFYTLSGALIAEGQWSDFDGAFTYCFDGMPSGSVIARFTASTAIPGDIDGSGSVTVSDAVTALRLAMQLLDGTGLDLESGDMDGNGSVTIADAVVILRMAMGLL